MRRRWVRIVLVLALAFTVFVSFCFWLRHDRLRRGQEAVAQAIAEIERIDPHWRWEDIEAARTPVPDERNMADLAVQFESSTGVIAAIPVWTRWQELENLDLTDQVNEQPPERWLCELEALRSEVEPAYEMAREMVRRGGNRIPYLLPDNVISLMFPHAQGEREAAAMLRWETIRLAAYGRADEALPLVGDALTLAEALREEPIIIPQLVRLALQAIAVGMLERILAQGELLESEKQLLALSAQLDLISRRPVTLSAMRGERAMMHQLFVNLESGKIKLLDVSRGFRGQGAGGGYSLEHRIDGFYFAPGIPAQHAVVLRRLTAYIDILQAPQHQWKDALAKMPAIPRDQDHVLVILLIGANEKVIEAEVRVHAQMGCARVAIACELHRLRHGEWPRSLGEIAPELLPDPPTDPYTGGPLKLAVVPTGLIVHADTGVTFDVALANVEDVNDLRPPDFVGFRLWDPELRGLESTVDWLPESERELEGIDADDRGDFDPQDWPSDR